MLKPQEQYILSCFNLAQQEVMTMCGEDRPQTTKEFAKLVYQYTGNGKHGITVEQIETTMARPLSDFIPI